VPAAERSIRAFFTVTIPEMPRRETRKYRLVHLDNIAVLRNTHDRLMTFELFFLDAGQLG
jgi:hypothetical protein